MKSKILRKLIPILDHYLTKYRDEPVIYVNYLEALFQNGDYFHQNMDNCIDPYGFSYGAGWHFYTSMVQGIDKRPENEVIKDFVTFLQIIYHENVYEGFRLKFKDSEGLKKYAPPFLAFLTPWSPYNVDTLDSRIENTLDDEKLLTGSESGSNNPLHNPEHLAINHYQRLSELRKSILENGYQWYIIPNDPVKGHILKRGNEYRILIFSGQHRVAALSGLGYNSIPVKFASRYLISAEDVDVWPLVKSGLWNRQDALMYFHHLFDFDSRSWAIKNGLMRKT